MVFTTTPIEFIGGNDREMRNESLNISKYSMPIPCSQLSPQKVLWSAVAEILKRITSSDISNTMPSDIYVVDHMINTYKCQAAVLPYNFISGYGKLPVPFKTP
jgi:hypothetical protein